MIEFANLASSEVYVLVLRNLLDPGGSIRPRHGGEDGDVPLFFNGGVEVVRFHMVSVDVVSNQVKASWLGSDRFPALRGCRRFAAVATLPSPSLVTLRVT